MDVHSLRLCSASPRICSRFCSFACLRLCLRSFLLWAEFVHTLFSYYFRHLEWFWCSASTRHIGHALLVPTADLTPQVSVLVDFTKGYVWLSLKFPLFLIFDLTNSFLCFYFVLFAYRLIWKLQIYISLSLFACSNWVAGYQSSWGPPRIKYSKLIERKVKDIGRDDRRPT